jgi:DNA-binding transcriptional LysR family regulator
MPVTLRQLRTFMAVAEARSVSAAAQELGLTQPAASQQLRELERRLGVRLLERAKGRMIPTAAGEAVLSGASRVHAAVDDLVAAAAGYRAGGSGRLRIGTGATACIYLLPPVLAGLKRRMPEVEVIISTGNTPDMLRRVEDGSLDAAVVTLPTNLSRSLSATRIARDPLMAILPTEMVSKGMTAVSTHDLATMPLILYEPGGVTRAIIDAWFRRAGQVPRPVMELGSVEAIKVLVRSGRGCSILPALALGEFSNGLQGPVRVPAKARMQGNRSRTALDARSPPSREQVSGSRGSAALNAVAFPLRPRLSRELAMVLRREKVLDRALRLLLDEIATAQTPPLTEG